MIERTQELVVTQEQIDALRAAISSSIQTRPIATKADIGLYFTLPAVGSPVDCLSEQLRVILIAGDTVVFNTHHLRTIAGSFHLQNSLDGELPGYDRVLSAIAAGLEAGAGLKPPSDPIWVEAATIGRALIVLGIDLYSDKRHLAVAAAAKRLKDAGVQLSTSGAGIDRTLQAWGTVTADISQRFERLGLVEVLKNLCGGARRAQIYAFDQYLFGRQYSYIEREPSAPFGFLFNLAVKAPDQSPTSDDLDRDWRESIEMARDLVAILDVEPYSKFWMVNQSPTRMGRLLEDVGLYDHLFGLRQWSIFVTPLLLESFFGTVHDEQLTAYHGWNTADAVKLARALVCSIRTDPARINRTALLSTGLTGETLDRMLPNFVHSAGDVNRAYTSPLAAKSADFMFRPLIAGSDGTYIAPVASLIGPACYEVVAAAMRDALPAMDVADLVGKGTERAVAALLRFRGFKPTFEGAKYNEGKSVDAGECDLVLEDDKNILLIECKGKALTRATMAAQPGAAMLDYAGGVIASQVQALQHERLLFEKGEILFDDGKCLRLNGRKVTRLSVTLLDHGSLQDRFLFINFVRPLLRAEMAFDAKDPDQKRYKALNAELDRQRREMKASQQRGRDPWEAALSTASLSFGQLATLITDIDSLEALIDRIRIPTTYATMNPLLEFYHLQKQGLLRSAPEKK